MDWISFAGTVGASALGAGLTAVLSFRFALARFKREQGVNLRIEWYQKAINLLSKLGFSLFAFSSLQRHHGIGVSEGKFSSFQTSGMEILELLHEAELYATQESYDGLALASKTAYDLLSMEREHLNPDSDRHQEALDILADVGYAWARAGAILVKDVRKELGLGELKEGPSWDKETPGYTEEMERLDEIRAMLGARRDQRWSRLNLDLIERVLLRRDQSMRSEEAIALAEDLEFYAAHLREQHPPSEQAET